MAVVDTRFSAIVKGKYWRQEDAEVVLDAMAGSGRPLADFARHWGISEKRLRRWRRRLDAGAQRSLPAHTPVFHPVQVVVDQEVAASDATGFELVLRCGRRIVVGTEFDAEALERLVRVVESWRC